MIDGFINVYKEQGFTSFDVVAKLRGILKQKKIGHTGTLDPLAEGVLLVCLGQATKMCDLLIEKNKTYRCVMLLGQTTDTEDVSGKVLSTCDNIPETEQVVDTLLSFKGEYEQIPPMYSAIKVNGKKLYEYARAGIEIERQPRHVEIYNINIEQVELPRVTFTVSCSKGTYIRSLCRDIGDKLGCGAVMERLIRTEVKDFRIEDSLTLSQIEEARDKGILENYVQPMDLLMSDLPELHIKKDVTAQKLLANGNKLKADNFIEDTVYKDTNVRVYNGDNKFVALYTYDKANKIYKPYKMFCS
jgi:tRNA pseudouridine55 synthase